MHVHGSQLNLNSPVEAGARKNSGASERGAELRKKLKSAASQGFDEAVEDEFRVSGQQDEGPGQQQDSDRDAGEPRAEFERGEEAEALTERRTSLWA